MDISVHRNGSQIRMQIAGDIDESGAAEIKRQFENLDLSGVTEAVFNLRDVGYIGSAGLGKFLLFYKKLSAQEAVMKIEHPSEMIRDILIELRLDALFSLV